jgi:hypothetical protein
MNACLSARVIRNRPISFYFYLYLEKNGNNNIVKNWFEHLAHVFFFTKHWLIVERLNI